MFIRKLGVVTLCASLFLGVIPGRAQDAGALLDLLVKKKIITDQEAEEVRAELTKEVSTTPAGKWKMSAPITELELYGDTRVRYEYRGGETASNNVDHPNDSIERQRERYRLRIGLRGVLADDWFFGVRLETSQNPRSTNVTFGDDTSTFAATSSGSSPSLNGPFAKNSDGLNIGQAYIGYRGIKDFTFTVGKMPNPLVNTSLLWDADINPEGVAEQWKRSFTFNLGSGQSSSAAASYSKDGKTIAAAGATSEPVKMKLDLFANFGQFIYDDVNPENPLGGRKTTDGNLNPRTDAWLLAWQVGARFTFPNNLYAQAAPTLYNYTGNGDNFNTHFVGGDPALPTNDSLALNQTGINNLLVFDVPTEVGWKVGELPMRVFGDFAVNFNGGSRAAAAGFPNSRDQRYAVMAGVGIGQLKAKRDWQIQAWYQRSEQFALDPNLVDSDVFDSRLNLEGFAVQAGYALSDAVIFNLTYAYGWRIDKSLGTGGLGDIGINPLEKYQLFQADLNLKF